MVGERGHKRINVREGRNAACLAAAASEGECPEALRIFRKKRSASARPAVGQSWSVKTGARDGLVGSQRSAHDDTTRRIEGVLNRSATRSEVGGVNVAPFVHPAAVGFPDGRRSVQKSLFATTVAYGQTFRHRLQHCLVDRRPDCAATLAQSL
jgi:hypothetical protein